MPCVAFNIEIPYGTHIFIFVQVYAYKAGMYRIKSLSINPPAFDFLPRNASHCDINFIDFFLIQHSNST